MYPSREEHQTPRNVMDGPPAVLFMVVEDEQMDSVVDHESQQREVVCAASVGSSSEVALAIVGEDLIMVTGAGKSPSRHTIQMK